MDLVGFSRQPIWSVLDEAESSARGQGGGDGRITIILDTRGCIQYCSAPTMFSSGECELQGQPVSMVIPGLPFRARTPGYNVAYSRFAFENDRWQRQSVKLGDDRSAPMDLTVRAIPINHGYCLLVLLKPIAEAPSDQIALRKPPLRYVPASRLAHARHHDELDSNLGLDTTRHEEPLLRAACGW